MPRRWLLCDVGGTHTKMVLMVDGEVLDRYIEPTVPLKRNHDGSATLDPAALRRHLLDMKARFGQEPFERIAVSCQMGCFLFVDKFGRARSPVVSWQDRRVLTAKSDSVPIYFEMRDQLLDLEIPFWDGTGPDLPIFYLKRMVECDPGLKGQHIVSLGQFAMSCLGFEKDLMKVPIGVTEAAASGLLNPVTKAWVDPLIDYVGIDGSRLPARISDHSEDPSSSPAAALGDFQAAILGVNLGLDEVYVNVSTGGQVAVFCDDPSIEFSWYDRNTQIRPFLGERLIAAFTHLPAGRLLSSLNSSEVVDRAAVAESLAVETPEDPDPRVRVEFDRGLTGDFSIHVRGFDRLSSAELTKALEAAVIGVYCSLVEQHLNSERATVVLSGGLLAARPRLLSLLRENLSTSEVRTVLNQDASLLGLERFCMMGNS